MKGRFSTLLLSCLILLPPTWAQAEFQTYQVERLNGGQPILTEQHFLDAGIPEDGGNINGPSVIKVPDWIAAEDRADPAANYYLYFGHHGGKYIRMAWAKTLLGPWQLYNMSASIPQTARGVLGFANPEDHTTTLGNGIQIKDHMASPRVFIDDVNRRFVLFFHAPSGVQRADGTYGSNLQKTLVALSDDGLNFRDGIQPVRIGSDYLDPFTYLDQTYGFANQGFLHKAPAGATLENGGWWAIPEGHNFKDDLWPRREGPVRADHQEDPDELAKNPRHFSQRIVGNQAHIFFHRRDDAPESLLLTKIDLDAGDWTQWDSTYPPEHLLSPELDWEGVNHPLEPSTGGSATGVNQLRDPFIFEEDGRIFLFYCGAGEEAIGLAELIPSPTFSSIRGHIWFDPENRPWLATDVLRRSDSPHPWTLEITTELRDEQWSPREIDQIDTIAEVLDPNPAGDHLWEQMRFRTRLPAALPDHFFLRLTYPR